jgi:hypothetical protein
LNVLAEISGQKSRRAFLTSHVPGSTSTVQVEPQKENPRESASFYLDNLDRRSRAYNERNEARRSQPLHMQISVFDGDVTSGGSPLPAYDGFPPLLWQAWGRPDIWRLSVATFSHFFCNNHLVSGNSHLDTIFP